MAPPFKKTDDIWTNGYRDRILAEEKAEKREKDRLRKQEARKRQRAQAAAAAAEDGPPVTKKARVRGPDGNDVYVTGEGPTEINAGDTKGRRRKTATRSDKLAQVRTTRRNRDKDEPHNRNEASNDETTNGKEGKETEDNPDNTLNPTSADHLSGEDRTSRRRNKKTKEPAANIASTQALETGLAKDTDDVMVISVDKAPTSIALATGTESEGKISTEDISTAQSHKHVEVEPQPTPTVSATPCIMNQSFIVNVYQNNVNNVHQQGQGFSLNCVGSSSALNRFNLKPLLSSITQEATTLATAQTCTSDTSATATQDAGTTQS